MKKVLITGAGGFTAQHFIPYLQSLKKYEIFAGYRKPPQKKLGVSPVYFDIKQIKSVESAIKKIRPDFVCHFAAQTNVRLSSQQMEETFETNVLGTLNLAHAILRFAPHCKLLFTSSIHVYGRALKPGITAKETDRLWPESPYAMSKALSEFICLDLFQRFGLQSVILRINNLVGTGQNSDFVFSNWCQQIACIEKKRQRPFIRVGNINVFRDFLPIQDATRAYEILLRKGRAGTIYNVASGTTRQLAEYLRYLCHRSTISIKIKKDAKRFRKNDPDEIKIDIRRLKSLGWKPRKSVFQTLDQLLLEWRGKV